jgi:hypothetical protein
MSPRNEVFQAIPFDASSDANEPLIAAGDAEEEEDRRLQEKVVSRFKFSSLLLGLLVGFIKPFFALGVNGLVVAIWSEDAVIKTKTDIFISLLSSLFFFAISFVIFGFLHNRVAITYSAIGGRAKDLPEEMVLHMENLLFVGVLVGISLAWTVAAVHLGMWAQAVYSSGGLVVAFLLVKIIKTCFATDIKPPSSRRSTAEQTMIIV